MLTKTAVSERTLSDFEFARKLSTEETTWFRQEFGVEFAYKLQFEWDCGCGFRMASHASAGKTESTRLHPLRDEDHNSNPNPSAPVFRLLTAVRSQRIEPLILSYWSLDGIEGVKPLELNISGLIEEEFAVLANHLVTYV